MEEIQESGYIYISLIHWGEESTKNHHNLKTLCEIHNFVLYNKQEIVFGE